MPMCVTNRDVLHLVRDLRYLSVKIAGVLGILFVGSRAFFKNPLTLISRVTKVVCHELWANTKNMQRHNLNGQGPDRFRGRALS